MDLFDLYQHGRIRRTDNRVRFNEQTNDNRHRRARDDVDDLHGRIDRLTMITEALWSLLAEREDFTEEQLSRRLLELDQQDGVADGRRQPMATDCSCGAKVNPRAKACVFCGAPPPDRSLFDQI